MDQRFDDERVDGGDRRGFDRRRHAAEQAGKGDHRQRELPLGIPQRSARSPASNRRRSTRAGAWRSPQIATNPTISRPGRMPARNISSIETLAMIA